MMLEKREGKREGSIDTIRVQITDIVLGSKFSNGLKICYNAKRSIDMMLRKREGIKRQASIDTSYVYLQKVHSFRYRFQN